KVSEEFCARVTALQDSTCKLALLKIGPGRSCCVEHDTRGEPHKIRRAANVCDPRPDRTADRFFACRGTGGCFVFFSEAVGKEANEESSNAEHGRSDDEKIRGADVTHVMLGDISAEDRPESAADGDETVKA